MSAEGNAIVSSQDAGSTTKLRTPAACDVLFRPTKGLCKTSAGQEAYFPSATFLRREEFGKAGRPELLVFVDEHEDSLSTCIFYVDRDRNLEVWSRLPASRHAGSGVISYTDGHAEIHRWRDARTLLPVKGVFQGGVVATGSLDWKYVWERLTKGTAAFGDP